jgi:hypothetical protein
VLQPCLISPILFNSYISECAFLFVAPPFGFVPLLLSGTLAPLPSFRSLSSPLPCLLPSCLCAIVGPTSCGSKRVFASVKIFFVFVPLSCSLFRFVCRRVNVSIVPQSTRSDAAISGAAEKRIFTEGTYEQHWNRRSDCQNVSDAAIEAESGAAAGSVVSPISSWLLASVSNSSSSVTRLDLSRTDSQHPANSATVIKAHCDR